MTTITRTTAERSTPFSLTTERHAEAQARRAATEARVAIKVAAPARFAQSGRVAELNTARARAAKQDEAVHEAHTRGSFGSVCKVYERTQSTSLRLYLLDSFSYLSIYLSIYLFDTAVSG